MTRTLAILAMFLHPGAAWAQRAVKAKVEEPVLPELMGGCSMRCAFPWKVEMEEEGKVKAVKMLNDEKPETAWTTEGAGVGAKFRLSFPKKLPAEVEGTVPFYGFDLINGAWETNETWKRHGRVKKARLLYNGKPLLEVTFADNRRWQRVTFDDIMVRSGDVLTFEVLEVYPGEKMGLAISEMVLQGAH